MYLSTFALPVLLVVLVKIAGVCLLELRLLFIEPFGIRIKLKPW